MSFPVVIQSQNDAEHRNDYAATDQRWLVGQKMVNADGRAYRYALVGGSTLVVGDILDGPANITNHISQTPAAQAAGLKVITCLFGNTVSAKNQYRGGYVSVVTTPNGGETQILLNSINQDTHAAVSGNGTITATLATGETIVSAITTSTRLSFILNPYAGVIQSPITTSISAMQGVAVKASTTGRFGWIQTRGVATVLASGTPVLGANAVRLIGAAAAAGPAATAPFVLVVGRVLAVGSTWLTVDLLIDG